MRYRFLLLFPALLAAQSLKDFEKKVTEFTLPNGLRFLIIERHGAPVVSFNTYVNAGSVDDPSGQTEDDNPGEEDRQTRSTLLD